MSTNAEKKLQTEFNEWAEAGRGDEMERHHLPNFEPTLPLMDVKPTDRVLDIGCGSGCATRLVAKRFHPKNIIGIDISDEIVRLATEHTKEIANMQTQNEPA